MEKFIVSIPNFIADLTFPALLTLLLLIVVLSQKIRTLFVSIHHSTILFYNEWHNSKIADHSTRSPFRTSQ